MFHESSPEEMARCPKCDTVLSEEWLIRAAASLMGKLSSAAKSGVSGPAERPARCGTCGGKLSDDWIRHVGAL